ncbi:MAG: methyl-accepting chemotaxis protein [Thermodesulfobacteriota bacterium]
MFWKIFHTKSATARRDFPAAWRPALDSLLATLQQLAGATENEFLQIGEQMQGIYLRSGEITRLADHLVDSASGGRMQTLLERLRRMMADMEDYLAKARSRNADTFATLRRVQELLGGISAPLHGFRKMDMTLHMLGVSIKIESARLGDLGAGFVNLALDVEKLSRQINDKSEAIIQHQRLLAAMLAENIEVVASTESMHDAEVTAALAGSADSLHALEAVNDRFTRLGAMVAAVSGEIAGNIGAVVSSMQFHDIHRQQVEHVAEALAGLAADLDAAACTDRVREACRALIVETGNVCELQEAQLRFAATEFHAQVASIVENLREVARKQTALGEETLALAGMGEGEDASFLDGISRGMATVTRLLGTFADADREMAAALKQVAATIGEITVFVTDIESIGYATVHIALNAQIKAAHSGVEGAALEVLAKEIKQLSDETVQQTDAIASALGEINDQTKHLAHTADEAEAVLSSRISGMGGEVEEIVRVLGEMSVELREILGRLHGMVGSLSEEVEQVTGGIDVHERSRAMAEEVAAVLHGIVGEARELEPASEEFKENLRRMEERYTMESERRIHEAIAARRAGQSTQAGAPEQIRSDEAAVTGESEFGDNVDLF